MMNQIPKSYLHHDLYCNLIPNEDPNSTIISQVPRTGAFEVSFNGHVSLAAPLGFRPNAKFDFYFYS